MLLCLVVIAVSCSQTKTYEQKLSEVKNLGFERKIIKEDMIEYRSGNLPLIVTVPHGGLTLDSTLEVRTKENCPDPKLTKSYDSHTPELADLVDSICFAQTGMYPHIVRVHLKRIYIDVNRPKNFAIVTGCEYTSNVYDKFYSLVAEAKQTITEQYGTGLMLDFHAHGHKKQEIEIGYQIKKADMNMSDEELNASDLAKTAGIYHLILNNKLNLNFAEMIRGENAFGSILNREGIPCIPNDQNKQPLDTKYFSGAQVTKVNGSCSGGTINAIQLEFNRDSRKEPLKRLNTAEKLVKSIGIYMDTNYIFN